MSVLPRLRRRIAQALFAALVTTTFCGASFACEGGVCPAYPAAKVPVADTADKSQGKTVAVVTGMEKLTAGGPKRQSLFMTAMDDNGEAYSYANGPEKPQTLKWIGLAMVMFIGLVVYLIVTLPSNVSPAGTGELRSLAPGAPGAAPLVDESSDSLPEKAPPATIQPSTDGGADAGASPTWADLVRACNGDPIRAATIIAGELAADPKLTADSPLAIARACARFPVSTVK